MAKVVTEFDIELAKWQAKIQQIKADMKSTQTAARQTNLSEAMMGGASGVGGGGKASQRLGMLSMQVQDIAVQAQMGTAAMTILAQQGSQVASIFGPGGAILGGVIALGGALVMAGQKGAAAFKTLMDGASAVRTELDEMQVGGAGIDELIKGLTRLEKSTESLEAARANLQGFKAAATTALGLLTGGPGMDEKKMGLDNEMAAAEAERLQAATKLLDVSAQQVEIANMRAKGLDEEADALERQIALERDLAKIRATSLDASTKERLIQDRKAVETAGDAGREKDKADKKAKEEEAKEEKKQQQIEAERDQKIEEERARQEKIEGMKKQLEEGRIELLPDDQKLGEYERKLKEAQERAASSQNFGDEEGRLKAELEAQEMQRKIKGLSGNEEEKAVKSASTPGGVAGALNILFGRSANELILDESKQQTAAVKENNRILTRIETLLKDPNKRGQVMGAFPEVFAP